MENVEAIRGHLRQELERQGRDTVGPDEAEEWLTQAGLLEVHPTGAGNNIRDLLRDGELQGHQVNGRWTIELADVGDIEPPHYHYEVERPHAWVVRAGKGAKHVDDFRRKGIVAIGYPPSGNLTGMSADEIVDHVKHVFSDQPVGKIKNLTHQFQAFALGIQPDDLILTPTDKHSEVLIGRTIGPYEYGDDPLAANFKHYHRVKWLHTVKKTELPAATQKSLGAPITVFWAGAVDKLRKRFPKEEDSSRQAWIFQANPAVWDIRHAAYDLAATDFSILRYKDKIKAGDIAFLWESGPNGGIVGVAHLLENPIARSHTPDQYQVSDSPVLRGIHPRADIRILHALDPPISRAEVKAHPGLQDLAILRFAQGTNFPVTPDEARILHDMVDDRARPSLNKPLGPPKWTNAWWVNQRTFKEECEGGYVWAPNTSKGGGPPKKHWQALKGMRTGDLILHYNKQAIQAVSRVTRVAEVTDRPSGLPLNDWEGQGWHVLTQYSHLKDPIRLNEIPEEWRLAEKGPFDVNGGVKQQYANYLSGTFVQLLIDQFGDRIRNGTTPIPHPAGDDLDSTLLDLIKRRMNVVFYGPPGTGKTFEALAVAAQWERIHGEGTVRKITFHPSYGYEDFVQGFRPKRHDPGAFALQPGILLRICNDAQKNDQRKYLLLIDEINRGDVARVFGELITYIESDKRGVPFDLSQDHESKYAIPPNVYFLGTMNTADKSVSLLDVALRRRFAFVEFRADPDAFSRIPSWVNSVQGLDLGELLDVLNQRLLAAGIEVDRAIGHALLSVPTDAPHPAAVLKERIEYDIAPLVAEYSYLDRDRIERILPDLVDPHGRFLNDLSEDDVVARLKLLVAGAAPSLPTSPPDLGAELEVEALQTQLEQ